MGWRDGIPVGSGGAAYTKGERIDNPAEDFQTTLQFGPWDTGVQLPVDVSQALAGVGSGLMDIAHGAGQRINVVDEKAIKEKRRLDAPLLATTPGAVGNVVGQAAPFIAASAMWPGAAGFTGQTLSGAGWGTLQGLLTPTAGDEDALQNTLLGLGIGGLSGAGGHFLSAAIRPSQGVRNPALMNKAKDMGFQVRIGDQLESVNLRNIEDVMRFLPFTGGKELALDQANSVILNRTLAKNMGITAAELEKSGGQITRDIVDKAVSNIGRKFEFLSKGKMFNTTKREFNTALNSARQQLSLLEPEIRAGMPQVDNWLGIAERWQKNGWISGDRFQANRSQLSKRVRDLYKAGNSAEAGVLDDILEAFDSVTPDTAAWKEARKQWAVYKMVEKNPNLLTPTGDVMPKQLKKSLAGANKQASARGRQGDLGEVADIATSYLHDPNSATAQRSFWMNVLTNPLFAGGAAAGGGGLAGGFSQGGDWDWGRAATGMAIGLGTPALAQTAMRHPLGQAYLKHGILGSAGNYLTPLAENALPALSVANFMQPQ